MIAQGLNHGDPQLWLERLCRTLFWALWMLSPLPLELAQPALRLLSDLTGRAHHLLTH